MDSFTHSFTQLFIHLFSNSSSIIFFFAAYSFIRLFFHSIPHTIINSLIQKFAYSSLFLSLTLFLALAVPIAHYPLNIAYGAQEKDGKQPSGVIHGSVTPAPGPHNEPEGAYEFPGTSDSYIEFPNDGGLDTRFSITLMCWVQPGGQDGPLFNYRESGPWGVHIWINFKKFFNRITVRDTHAFRTAISSFEELAEGQWYHVAATYDHNTGVNSLFINGDPDNSLFIDTGYEISTNDNKVRMGVKAGDGRYFKGKITQMKVYDFALNADQIQAAMNAEGKLHIFSLSFV